MLCGILEIPSYAARARSLAAEAVFDIFRIYSFSYNRLKKQLVVAFKPLESCSNLSCSVARQTVKKL